MKTVYNRLPNTSKFDENKNAILDCLKSESELKRAINLNHMKEYVKLNVPEVGDFVTCCDFRDSLISKTGDANRNRAGSWARGLTFKVNEVMYMGSTYGIFGYAGNPVRTGKKGVYLEAVRMATEEEINKLRAKL